MSKKKQHQEGRPANYEHQTILPVDINAEMKKSYIEYAMSVIISRALPDVRDGLKPVHRRILYTMYQDGLVYEKPFRKAATTVGAVLGRFHPHGDASVYDALVRMAQDFSLRYRRARQLRLHRRRPARRLPLHRGQDEPHRRRDAFGHREGHR